MATLSTTTLSSAVTAGSQQWPLASLSAVTAITSVGGIAVLYADGEACFALSTVGSTANVQRGMAGSTNGAHASGATVYVGTQSQFYQSDPMGAAPAVADVIPWINTVNGTIWTATNGVWVLSGSSSSGGSSSGGTITTPTITGGTITGSTLTSCTLVSPTISGSGYMQVATVDLAGAAWHTGNGTADYLSWTVPATGVVARVVVNITTKSTGAATADIGTATASNHTSSDNLLDGLDIGTAAILADNFGTPGTNGKYLQGITAAKWITFHALADPTGAVGTAYIYYFTL